MIISENHLKKNKIQLLKKQIDSKKKNKNLLK